MRLHNTTQTSGPVADGLIERAPALSPIHDLSTNLPEAATTRARKGERGKSYKSKIRTCTDFKALSQDNIFDLMNTNQRSPVPSKY